MTIEEMKKRISDIDTKIKQCQEKRKNVTSDFSYWSYIQEEELLKKEKRQLEKELYYADIKSAINDFLVDEDVAQSRLKKELFKILDEYKKLS